MAIDAQGRKPPGARRAGGVWLVALLFASFLTGLATASWPALGDRAMRFLALMGQPRLDAIRAMEEPVAGPDGVARSDWLVFFEDDAAQAERDRLLARHESIRFVEKTFFSNGVVVSIPEPSRRIVGLLRASPAVWLMLRDRAFYLCH